MALFSIADKIDELEDRLNEVTEAFETAQAESTFYFSESNYMYICILL